MIIGTIFTLFFVPSIYVLVAKTRAKAAAARMTAPRRSSELVEAVG